MKLLLRIDRVWAVIEKAVAVTLFAALVLSLFFNILSRSLLGLSFHTILEFTPAMVLWLALLGASLALRQGSHIKIELLLRYLSPPLQAVARRVSAAFGMAVMGLLLIASLEFVGNEIAMFGPAGALSAILPIFFCGSLFRFLISALDPQDRHKPPASHGMKSGTPNTELS
jgi:TRAP-type C4-dicarboxylate transport system permease small subunit